MPDSRFLRLLLFLFLLLLLFLLFLLLLLLRLGVQAGVAGCVGWGRSLAAGVFNYDFQKIIYM